MLTNAIAQALAFIFGPPELEVPQQRLPGIPSNIASARAKRRGLNLWPRTHKQPPEIKVWTPLEVGFKPVLLTVGVEPNGIGPGAQRTFARAMARSLAKGKLLKHPKTGVLHYDRPKPTRAEIEASRSIVRAGYFDKRVPGTLAWGRGRGSLNARRIHAA